MKVLSSREIKDIQIFLRQYYSFEDFEVSAGLLNEREWTVFGRFIRKFQEWFREALKELAKRGDATKITKITDSDVYTHAGAARESPWGEVGGYFCQAVPLLIYVKLYVEEPLKSDLTKLLEGRRFAIWLRARDHPDRFSLLVGLFHELLHAIELTSNKSIYRGDSQRQEEKDTREIVEPLVKLFMRTQF